MSLKAEMNLKEVGLKELLTYMANKTITNMLITSRVKVNSADQKFNKSLFFKRCVHENDIVLQYLEENQFITFDGYEFNGRVFFPEPCFYNF